MFSTVSTDLDREERKASDLTTGDSCSQDDALLGNVLDFDLVLHIISVYFFQGHAAGTPNCNYWT